VADDPQYNDSRSVKGRELEVAKMYQDTFKHMTTFCSGAILLSAAVVSALFPEPHYLWLLITNIVSFVFGAASAMLGLYFTPRYLDLGRSTHAFTSLGRRFSRFFASMGLAGYLGILSWYLRTSVVLAYFGVLVFALFATANIYSR
jgi:hypothetical protein